MGDGKEFGIVGCHTTGGLDKNWGVALNKEKIEWMNNNMYNEPIVNRRELAIRELVYTENIYNSNLKCVKNQSVFLYTNIL